MRRILISAALAASTLVAAPALAQSWNSNGYGSRYGGQRVPSYQLRQMVERAIQRRSIPWETGRNLRAQVDYIQQLERRGQGGWEQREIDRRTDLVLQQLNSSGSGYDRRSYDSRYGEDRNGYNGRSGYNNGSGYDDRGYSDDRSRNDDRDRNDARYNDDSRYSDGDQYNPRDDRGDDDR